MDKQELPIHNFDLDSFKRAQDKMIATNDHAYSGMRDSWRAHIEKVREYTPDEIARIIESGSLVEQQKLSRNYFYKDGYYKQIIIYFATLLKYAGLLIPNPSAGKNLSTSHIQKRYYSAMDLIESMELPVWFTNCAQRALVDGCYYGVRIDGAKNEFKVLDLPAAYCCSRFKDQSGNDLIEFDLTYFNTIADPKAKEAALAAYPKAITKAYKNYSKGKNPSKWFIIPSDIGVCFPFFDGRPLFLSVIPKTIEYDKAVETEQTRDEEEIRKIIVQQIPHLTDGRLLFEPDEAEEIHNGTVGMLKGDKNLSVLTTYGDVSAIASNTSTAKTDDTLNKIEQNIYAQAGVSGQIFASTGSGTLNQSLNKDLALMMYIANKFSYYITRFLNEAYGNGNITFKYMILPISYYNADNFLESSFKLVGSGYSFLMPALALGISQKDLGSIKDLENNVLKLGDKLKPLSTSYTQSAEDSEKSAESDDENKTDKETIKLQDTNPDIGGRPSKKDGDKAEKTIKNEESKK